MAQSAVVSQRIGVRVAAGVCEMVAMEEALGVAAAQCSADQCRAEQCVTRLSQRRLAPLCAVRSFHRDPAHAMHPYDGGAVRHRGEHEASQHAQSPSQCAVQSVASRFVPLLCRPVSGQTEPVTRDRAAAKKGTAERIAKSQVQPPSIRQRNCWIYPLRQK